MLYKLKKVFKSNGLSLSIKARPKVLWWIAFCKKGSQIFCGIS